MTESLVRTITKVIESKPDHSVEAAGAWREGYHKGRADEREKLMQRFQAICHPQPDMQGYMDQIQKLVFS